MQRKNNVFCTNFLVTTISPKLIYQSTILLRKLIATTFYYLTNGAHYLHELYIQEANKTGNEKLETNHATFAGFAINHAVLLKFPYSSTFDN